MADETSNNEAEEIVGGRIEIVDVSKHPDPSIPDSELSLADMNRGRSKPLPWVLYGVLVLASIIAPYWLGRTLAARSTSTVVRYLTFSTPQGVALMSWAVTVVMFTGLGMAVVVTRGWLWRIVFAVGLAAEQFIAGICLLRLDFWFATYVMYGDAARYANAANLGIIAAGFGLAAFAVLWVGLLVLIRKDSPLNVLTHSWASFLLFYMIEAIALIIVQFGGLVTMV
ncbi:hypothetical protein [Bifidobacterium jacchi]|uniref:Teichoic acid transporter n=1 Tax=Bifidobacterium jacchi TaxID=2490545 RepID=A0A5N5RCN4_9BIFI|nr:hypothetical protein [Bifidobacterium jacchi]KAB5603989.1 hypothetical protein EHS19_10270 [Bifidobacterium jacchi]